MVTKHKLTVGDVLAMFEAGRFEPDQHVELLRGELYDMTPPSAQHAAWVDRVMRALERACGEEVIIRVQSPIRLDEHSAPEPDVSVLKFQPDFYEAELPGPDAVLLAVEVSRSTLRYDRGVKLEAYAVAGIPEVWLVNLEERKLEVYLHPSKGEYRSRTPYNLNKKVKPTAIPGVKEVGF